MSLSNNSTQIDISIIVVAYSIQEIIEECFLAIRNSADNLNKEIIYVDNGSNDDSVKVVKEKFPEIIIIESKVNLGFTRANNLAYPKTKGKYVLMLNADAFVSKDTLQKSYEFMEQHQDCGILGVRLIGRDGSLQPSARYFPTPWRLFLTKMGKVNNKVFFLKGIDNMQQDHNCTIECDWVPGCYLLTRKKIIEELDFFLRHSFFMYFDDADICLRIKRKGWKVIFVPIDVVHLGGANSEKIAPITEKGRQIAKFNLESEYIYFRQNYNLFYVGLNFFFIVLFAFLKILKKLLSFKSSKDIKEILKFVIMAFHILIKTHFGNKSIH